MTFPVTCARCFKAFPAASLAGCDRCKPEAEREGRQGFDLSRWRELQGLEYPNLLDYDASEVRHERA